MKIDEFNYLNGLSENAKKMIRSRVAEGQKNIYHSIMAILQNRLIHNKLGDVENEYEYYLKKCSKTVEGADQELLKESFYFVYDKFMIKRHKRTATTESSNVKPKKQKAIKKATGQKKRNSKDYAILGAFLKTFELSKISEKNIRALFDVYEQVKESVPDEQLINEFLQYMKIEQDLNES